MNRRTHVAVLLGGTSAERDVSLRSGAAVSKALAETGAQVTTVDVTGPDFRLPSDTEVAFLTLHGTFGEDGGIQQILEQRGVRYTFSGPEVSARAFDKARAKREFVAAGVLTPRYEVVERGCREFGGALRLKFPLVVKPCRQGSSMGVKIVQKLSELEEAVEDAGRYDDRVLLEQYIAGRELTVAILDDEALPVIEICPKTEFFTYEAKYTPGQTEYRVPAKLDKEYWKRAQKMALMAHQALGCRDLSRVDLMMAESGKMHVLECNTIPGFTETSLVPKAAQAAGISFGELCSRLVEMALGRRTKDASASLAVRRAVQKTAWNASAPAPAM